MLAPRASITLLHTFLKILTVKFVKRLRAQGLSVGQSLIADPMPCPALRNGRTLSQGITKFLMRTIRVGILIKMFSSCLTAILAGCSLTLAKPTVQLRPSSSLKGLSDLNVNLSISTLITQASLLEPALSVNGHLITQPLIGLRQTVS